MSVGFCSVCCPAVPGVQSEGKQPVINQSVISQTGLTFAGIDEIEFIFRLGLNTFAADAATIEAILGF